MRKQFLFLRQLNHHYIHIIIFGKYGRSSAISYSFSFFMTIEARKHESGLSKIGFRSTAFCVACVFFICVTSFQHFSPMFSNCRYIPFQLLRYLPLHTRHTQVQHKCFPSNSPPLSSNACNKCINIHLY